MKRISIAKGLGKSYLFSESNVYDPSKRQEFRDYSTLIDYLRGDEMKKNRKRNQLEILAWEFGDDEIEILRVHLKEIDFRGEVKKNKN